MTMPDILINTENIFLNRGICELLSEIAKEEHIREPYSVVDCSTDILDPIDMLFTEMAAGEHYLCHPFFKKLPPHTSIFKHGRAICFADGWFEWKKEGNTKQPYFIQRKDGQPIFMAAIGRTPFERGDHAEGFLIVTAAADRGLVDIHDRRPLVLAPEAAREWMRQDVTGAEAAD